MKPLHVHEATNPNLNPNLCPELSAMLAGNNNPEPQKTVVNILLMRALSEPDRLAYGFIQDAQGTLVSMTYLQLFEQAAGLAALLQQSGLSGERVLLMFKSNRHFIIAFYACLLAGAIAVPTPLARREQLSERLGLLAQNSQARAGISDAVSVIPELNSQTLQWFDTDFLVDSDALNAKALSWKPPTLSAEKLAFLQYTSGSTGNPKGVMVSHGNIMANTASIAEWTKMTSDMAGLLALPLFHDMGLIGGVLFAVTQGFPLYLITPAQFVQTPALWLKLISKYDVRFSGGSNFMFELAARAIQRADLVDVDLSSWHGAFCGAEPIRAETIRLFTEKFTPYGFRPEYFRSCYGMAEATLFVTGSAAEQAPRLDTQNGKRAVNPIVSCGPAGLNVELCIVEPSTSLALPDGVEGEVWVAGPSVAQGYWQNPQASSQTFTAHLANSKHGPFLRTGDLGYLKDGQLYVSGRLKDLIILGGRNYAPQDLELTVQHSHEGFNPNSGAAFTAERQGRERLVIVFELTRQYRKRSAEWAELKKAAHASVARNYALFVDEVVLIEPGTLPKTSSGKVRRSQCKKDFAAGLLLSVDEKFLLNAAEIQLSSQPEISQAAVTFHSAKNGDKYPVAFLVAAPNQPQLSEKSLHAHLSCSTLDAIQPAAFIYLTDLPRSLDGELNISALQALDIDALIEKSKEKKDSYQAPQGLSEITLAALWCDRLGIAQLSRHDNFFQLGGNSLLATQLAAQLEKTWGIGIAVAQIFATPTLAALAQALAQAQMSQKQTLSKADRKQALPLSFAQQRLWVLGALDQIEGQSSAAYLIPVALELRGALDTKALERAFAEIEQRHESLRTAMPVVGGVPVQLITPVQNFVLKRLTLSDLQGAAQDLALQDLIAQEAKTPFCLATGPLWRASLIELAHERHVLLLTMHHIVSDGWSMQVLTQELGALYAAFSQGKTSPLKALPIQYADFTVWQRQWLNGKALQDQVDYWQAQLLGAPVLLALPTDRPRPAVQTFAGSEEPVHIDAALTQALKSLSQAHHATLYMTLLTAFQVLLMRLSGQSDIVVGSPIANRTHAELENLIGFFVNTLVLRNDLSQYPESAAFPSFNSALAQTRQSALAAYAHQDLPFEKLVEELNPVRSMAHHPLFQVMFVLQNSSEAAQVQQLQKLFLGLEIKGLRIPSNIAEFDLTLYLSETENGLEGTLVYNTDLFDRASIARMATYFNTLIKAIVANPAQELSQLNLLTDTERQTLLVDWNNTQVDYPKELCLHQLFEAQVKRTPEAIAVVFENQQLSYQDLNAKANQLAHYLQAQGVRPDTLVGIAVERSIEMVVGLLGILKAGGAYLPLDPAYPAERIAFMLDDAKVALLLTQEQLLTQLPAHHAKLICLDNGGKNWTAIAQCDAGDLAPSAAAKHLAYVIYTSGSTGVPKGVMVEHRGLTNLAYNAQRNHRIDAHSAVLQFASLSFDAATYELAQSLPWGASLHLAAREALLPGDSLMALIKDQAITHITLPPSALAILDSRSCPSLQIVAVAGEVCPMQLATHWAKTHRFLNLYGPTESTVWATVNEYQLGAQVMHIGRPLPNLQLYILDSLQQPVPIGVAGELHIGGAQVARGYLNRPELTAEKFIPNPFSQDSTARLYKTGDLARYLINGDIEYLGRIDQQVKIRGFRIELGEVEAALLRHLAIREAVVIAREDSVGDKRLVAYWITKETETETENKISAETLRDHLRQSLPEYMLPAAFLRLDALPLTPNGKVDRKALPAPEYQALAAHYEAPQGLVETLLSGIWSRVLKIERIGRRDNFFTLGGHSLLVVRVIDLLRRGGWQLQVRDVFTASNLADLALLARAVGDAFVVPPNRIPEFCDRITPDMLALVTLTQEEIGQVVSQVSGGAANVQDIYPLTPLQQGILYHHLLSLEGDPYILSTVLQIASQKLLDALLPALQQVINRHDALRTSVHWMGLAKAVQVVWRQARMTVQNITLINADHISSTEEAAAQLYAQVRPRKLRMNLQQAPLMQVIIAPDPSGQGFLLQLLLHQENSDHVALEIMVEELALILQGRAQMLTPPLPYRNFVAQSMAADKHAQHEEFFQAMLGDIDEPTAPFGIMSTQLDGQGILEARADVAPALSLRLRQLARYLGVSAAALFHVSWALVVGRCSARDDVVFGTVMSGRLQSMTQGMEHSMRLMGMLINVLPIRLSFAACSAQEAVLRTQQRLADMLRHEQASLAMAQRCSAVPPPAPLFTALLNYRHS